MNSPCYTTLPPLFPSGSASQKVRYPTLTIQETLGLTSQRRVDSAKPTSNGRTQILGCDPQKGNQRAIQRPALILRARHLPRTPPARAATAVGSSPQNPRCPSLRFGTPPAAGSSVETRSRSSFHSAARLRCGPRPHHGRTTLSTKPPVTRALRALGSPVMGYLSPLTK